MILYSVMISWGRRKPSFLRSQKRWQPLLPLLMDHIRLDVDPDLDDGFYGAGTESNSGAEHAIEVPIEAKLRSLSVRLLYEACRVQKMSIPDLRKFVCLAIWIPRSSTRYHRNIRQRFHRLSV